MRRLVFLLLLSFQVVRSEAQTADSAKLIHNIDTLTRQGALFFMNGVFLQKPYHLNPDSIIEITILKHDKLNELFPNNDVLNHRPNDLAILISKGEAIATYQKKFSTFSKAYEKYLEVNKSDDSNLLYVVNGVPIVIERNSDIKKIFDSSEKLKSVVFIKSIYAKNVYPEHPRSALIITTGK